MAMTDPSQVPPSSYPFIGDCIGMESCVDFKPSESDGGVDSAFRRPYQRRRQEALRPARCRNIPPPIPCLAQTANQQSHMPWVMRRYYSGDGRLVIREEKVRHHEYFTAHRSNGRLTLRIVLLEVGCSPSSAADHRLSEDQSDSGDGRERCGGSPEASAASSSAEETSSASDAGGSDVAGGSGAGKCWDYQNVASTSCMFLMPALPLRPVHHDFMGSVL